MEGQFSPLQLFLVTRSDRHWSGWRNQNGLAGKNCPLEHVSSTGKDASIVVKQKGLTETCHNYSAQDYGSFLEIKLTLESADRTVPFYRCPKWYQLKRGSRYWTIHQEDQT